MSGGQHLGFRVMMWLWTPCDLVLERFVGDVRRQADRDRRRGVDPFPAMWDSGFGVVDGTPFIHRTEHPDQ